MSEINPYFYVDDLDHKVDSVVSDFFNFINEADLIKIWESDYDKDTIWKHLSTVPEFINFWKEVESSIEERQDPKESIHRPQLLEIQGKISEMVLDAIIEVASRTEVGEFKTLKN